MTGKRIYTYITYKADVDRWNAKLEETGYSPSELLRIAVLNQVDKSGDIEYKDFSPNQNGCPRIFTTVTADLYDKLEAQAKKSDLTVTRLVGVMLYRYMHSDDWRR